MFARAWKPPQIGFRELVFQFSKRVIHEHIELLVALADLLKHPLDLGRIGEVANTCVTSTRLRLRATSASFPSSFHARSVRRPSMQSGRQGNDYA